LGFGSGVACDLCEGAGEIGVVFFCKLVVEGFEFVVVVFEVGVRGDGVGD
jgi:hypothetical protein